MIEPDFIRNIVKQSFKDARASVETIYKEPGPPRRIVPRAKTRGRVIYIMKNGEEVQQ